MSFDRFSFYAKILFFVICHAGSTLQKGPLQTYSSMKEKKLDKLI